VALTRPYTEAELGEVGQQLVAVYTAGERDILALLSAKGGLTSWKRAFLVQQLSQVRAKLDELRGAGREWAGFHLPTLYEHSMDVVYDATGRPTLGPGGLSKAAHPGEVTQMDLGMVALHSEAIDEVVRSTVAQLDFATGGVGRRLDQLQAAATPTTKRGDVYRQKALAAVSEGLTQGETIREVGKRLERKLRGEGLTSFTDAAGREWTLGNYTEMVAMTTPRETAVLGLMNTMAEVDEDLVKVSSTGDPCDRCIPWQGELLSLTGATEGYPTYEEARQSGLHHPRCRHNLQPWTKLLHGEPEQRTAEEAAALLAGILQEQQALGKVA